MSPVPSGVSKKKYDSCVDKVKKKGSADNAYAVCSAQLQQAFVPNKSEEYTERKEEECKEDKAIGDEGWGKIYILKWASAFTNPSVKTKEAESAMVPAMDDSGFNAAQILITENPDINGSTLLNLLKSKGFQIVAPSSPQEADSASANTPSLRDGVKEAAVQLKSLVNFRESAASDDGIGFTKYRVALIKEGLGNLRDAFYYSRGSLQSAVALFEGKKCFANHPSRSEESDRPERDVREIIGHFQNCKLEEDADGRAMITADCCLMPDKDYEWARGLFRETIAYSKKYPDKDLVGLSINASGDALERKLAEMLESQEVPKAAKLKLLQAKDEGIETIRVVSNITEAMSCDLVTEAGAGGRIIKMLEGEANGKARDGKKRSGTRRR